MIAKTLGCGIHVAFLSMLTASTGNAQVVVYDGSVMPDSAGWQREGTFDNDRWIDDGWFHQFTELGDWAPEPIGQTDVYWKSVSSKGPSPSSHARWITDPWGVIVPHLSHQDRPVTHPTPPSDGNKP